MIRARIDSRQLERSLKAFSKGMDKDAAETIKDLARGGARQLAMRTEPYGLNSKSKRIGEMAISKDVSLAYATNARTYNELKKISPRKASAYAAAINANDQAAAEKIVRSIPHFKSVESTDSGQHLEGLRNSKGRVSSPSVTNLTTEGQIAAIRAQKLHTAHTAKAGWAQAGNAIQSKTRFPAWLKKAATLGSAKVISRGWKTVVTLLNHVKYTTNVLPSSKLNAALQANERNQIRRIQTVLQKRANRF